ncbi:MAG: hypothetical protein HZA31_06490 [Opitutae bacterium]|nr:hypothetical protein [Opitutae bacterium]
MKTPKDRALVLLILAVLGAGGLAWWQHRELGRLRAAGLSEATERNQLQRRIGELEKHKAELERLLSAARKSGAAGVPAGGIAAGPGENDPRRVVQRGPGSPQIRALMDSPEFQRLAATQQRAMLDGQYAALFKKLRLTPAQIEQFKTLLVEKQNMVRDVMAAARDQGLDMRQNRDQIGAMIQQSQAEVDSNIKSAIGATAFADYQQYEQTQPQRNLVNQLQQQLSYTATPLTETQAEQLVQILKQNAPASSTSTNFVSNTVMLGAPPPGGSSALPNVNVMVAPGGGTVVTSMQPPGGGTAITDQAVAQAQSVLSPQQVQALQQLQQQQQAAQAMQKSLRDAMGNQTPGAGGSTGNPPASTSNKPPGS